MSYITGLSAGTGYNRWFTDNNGNPRLFFADMVWGLPASAGRYNSGNYQADYDGFFSARARQGFTAIITHPWGHTHTGGAFDDGRTWDGLYPFTVNGTAGVIASGTLALNGGTANGSSFWQRIDYMFTSAANNGITIFFDLTMTCDLAQGSVHGFTNGVWLNVTNAQAQTASSLVAARYASTANLVWLFGDDYFADDDSFMDSVKTGISSQDTRVNSVTSIENNPSGQTARYDLGSAPGGQTPIAWGNSNATFNFVYYYNTLYFGIEYAYTEPSPLPPIWGDGFFWGDGGSNDQVMRNMVWWALSSGARGCTMGDDNVWNWPSGGLAAVTADGYYVNMAPNIHRAFTSLPGWWKLVPDTGNVFVTAGRGTRSGYNAAHYTANTDNYVSASIAADGSLAVIYCAAAMSITINQAKMQTGYRAIWIDPASGATQSTATGSTFASAGLGNNSAGGADWALALIGPQPPPTQTFVQRRL